MRLGGFRSNAKSLNLFSIYEFHQLLNLTQMSLDGCNGLKGGKHMRRNMNSGLADRSEIKEEILNKRKVKQHFSKVYFSSQAVKERKHIFDVASAVRPLDHGNMQGNKLFHGRVHPNFDIGDASNGGYMLTKAISAAREVIPFRDPITLSTHFVNKGVSEADSLIDVQILNQSKSNATVSIQFIQKEQLRFQTIGSFGDLSKRKGFDDEIRRMTKKTKNINSEVKDHKYSIMNKNDVHENFCIKDVDNIDYTLLPPLEECVNAMEWYRNNLHQQKIWNSVNFAHTIDLFVPKQSPFARESLKPLKVIKALPNNGAEGTIPAYTGYLRFADGGRLICLRSMAMLLDIFPPPILNICLARWAPTIEYTTRFFNRPKTVINKKLIGNKTIERNCLNPEFVIIDYRTTFIQNGWFQSETKLIDYSDRKTLLSSATQLARILPLR